MTNYAYLVDSRETDPNTDVVVVVDSDGVYVAQGATLSASGANFSSAIRGGDHNKIVIAGDVFGTYAGIHLNGPDGQDSIVVSSTGAVSGITYGVAAAGLYNGITNAGSIDGNTGVSTSGNSIIHNTGLIQGADFAVSVGASGATTNMLVNKGDIISPNVAFLAGSTSDTVINRGFIAGTMYFGDGGDLLDTRGGTVVGAVHLGEGNDRFDARGGGNVVGLVDLGEGNDTALGGDADDNLFGNYGDDVLRGRDGDDILDGFEGHDTLVGGAGRDEFTFTAQQDSAHSDLIVDFVRGEDTLVLQYAQFPAVLHSLEKSELLIRAHGHGANNANQHIIYDRSKGTLWYDFDGKGGIGAAKFAQLGTTEHPTTLTVDDFLIA